MEEIYFAGGCLWGVQEFTRYLPGVIFTEAGRANGNTNTLISEYDGYVECVRTKFDTNIITLEKLISLFFEIIDPYSLNKQGQDVGKKYRTGIYSEKLTHLEIAKKYIEKREDSKEIVVEVLPLLNYVKSADEHQDRLYNHPNDYCHIPKDKLYKYKINQG
jgi:peptide-methionine (S)-S-oxide reductase